MDTSRSIRTPLSSRAFFFLTIVFLMVLSSTRVCSSYELLIGTGDIHSFSFFAGKSICSIINNFDKTITCRPVPSEAYSDSLTNLQSGSLDMALVSSKMIYDASQGAGFFQYIGIQYDNLRLLMPLYKSPICLIARQDAKIISLDDLVGKRVNGGGLFSTESQVFGEIMSLKDWQKDNFGLFQNISSVNAQDLLAIKSGSVQAMLHVGMHPNNRLRRVLDQGRSTLIGINDADVNQMIDSRVGFSKCSIGAGTYPGLPGELSTLAMETLLITSADSDNETIQLILDAITGAKKRLQHAHPAFLHYKVGIETLNDSYLHPHPAAILFFQVNRDRL